MAQPVKLYICYAPEDNTALSLLKNSLSPLERSGKLQIWFRDKISAGDSYDQQIVKNLDQAQIIVMLVSINLLASEYYESREMAQALQIQQEARVRVIPIIVEHCLWRETALGALTPLPKEGRVAGTEDTKVWTEIAMGIHAIVNQIPQEQVEEAAEELVRTITKRMGKARKPTRTKAQQLTGTAIAVESPRASRAAVPTRSPNAPLRSEPLIPELPFGAEFEPATPEARTTTPAYGKDYDRLQSKINQIVFDILVWEPAQSANKIVADERRAIYHSLQEERHQCKLGTELPPPPVGMSLQDREIDQARVADMTVLLVEAPAVLEMHEFCSDYDEVILKKSFFFYPKKLKSPGSGNLDEVIANGFRLHYYHEEDITHCRVRTEVLEWVKAQRGCRYRNLRRRGR